MFSLFSIVLRSLDRRLLPGSSNCFKVMPMPIPNMRVSAKIRTDAVNSTLVLSIAVLLGLVYFFGEFSPLFSSDSRNALESFVTVSGVTRKSSSRIG